MSAGDAVRACLADDNVDAALEWSQRGMEDYLALGAKDSPQFVELHGALHARRGDYRSAVRLLGAAREQNRRAAMRWPARPQTPAILEEAARRLGAAAYEEAWQAGAGCTWPISRAPCPSRPGKAATGKHYQVITGFSPPERGDQAARTRD